LIKEYVEYNTDERRAAKTTSMKNLFKLLVNSVYGKFLENQRGRINGKVVASSEKIRKLINKHDFMNLKTFGEGLAFVERKKKKDVMDKPIHIGFFVLEHSKLLMMKFFYDVLQPYFGVENVHLLMTDTDSMILQIFSKDIPAQIKNDKCKLHELVKKWIDLNDSKTPGLMKDELGNAMMTEFIGLRSKMYSYKTNKDKTKNTAKGITKKVKDGLSFDDYKKILFEQTKMTNKMHGLRSFGHEINLVEMEKISLSAYDDKRVFIPNSFETLPIGY